MSAKNQHSHFVIGEQIKALKDQREELLEALDWCVAEINRDSQAYINARAVIAKATGEQK